MFNHKFQNLTSNIQVKLKSQFEFVQQKLQDFRPYNLGGFAINGLTPNKGFHFEPNIAYGLQPRQHLDLYRSSVSQSKSLIVFVHGGAWSRGDKSTYKFVGEAFTRSGHDVAVVNYHLAPEHIFPSYIDDLALALNFLELEKDQLGITTDKIILMGHSAGAFNIASLLYHPKALQLQNKSNIKAFIGIAGPYHFDYKGDVLAEPAFDTEVSYQDVMPYYFVEKNNIQHYLFIADQDTIVKHSNSYDFQTQLEACGNHCEVISIARTGHISIMGSISSLFSRYFNTRQAILKAIDQSLKDEEK